MGLRERRRLRRVAHGAAILELCEGKICTGERVAAQRSHWFRLVESKVAEHWAVRDDLGMVKRGPGHPSEARMPRPTSFGAGIVVGDTVLL